MTRTRNRILLSATAAVAAAGLFAGAPTASAQTGRESANGHGTLVVPGPNGNVRRQFSFSAHRNADGSVTGEANLTNPAFQGANGRSPYQLHVDVTCLKVIGNTAFMGGTTRRTNDPSLVDAVYFSVQDNGEPGAGRDMISRAFFFDDNPATQGDPQLCMGNNVGDFPMEPIEAGNVQVRAQ